MTNHDLLLSLLRTPALAERMRPLITALLLAELLAAGDHGPVPRAIGATSRARGGGPRRVARGRLVARSSLSGRRPRG